MGDYLKGASGDRLLRDVEDFARRQPWLVAAGGLALGFAASRFLKASSSRRYQSGDGGYQEGGYDRSSAGGYVGERRYDVTATSPTAPVPEYGTEVPYAKATTRATGTPVVGTYEPVPLEDEPAARRLRRTEVVR